MIGSTTHIQRFQIQSFQNPKAVLLTIASIFVLAACSAHQPEFPPLNERNKITVAETIQRLELYAPASGLKLSARDNDAVASFLSDYASTGQGPLYVNVPSTSDGVGTSQTQAMLRRQLQSLGMSAGVVQTGHYPSRPGVPAPLVVSYRRLTTAPMDCSVGGNLVATSNNQPYASFGCSHASNLAAMIDDPRQLLAPYEYGPLPADKRTTMIDNYKKGEPTATEIPERQRVTVNE